MNQIEKYMFHKRTFNIKDTIYLKEFETLLNASQDYRLECSCKIEGKKIYPVRFNIWYNKGNINNINLIFNFFKKVSKCPGITINYNLIKKVFNKNFNLEKTEQVVIGIDYRREINESRLKMWFIIRNYPEKMKEVLSIHGYDKKILDLIINDELLFGFDFYFDGRTNIKIYPHFNGKCLKDVLTLKKQENFIKYKIVKFSLVNKVKNSVFKLYKQLKSIFSNKIFDLIGECDELYVSFRGKGYKKVLHFHPRRRELFVKQLNNKRLGEISSVIKNKNFGNKGVVSLYEDEINNNLIKKVNIYY